MPTPPVPTSSCTALVESNLWNLAPNTRKLAVGMLVELRKRGSYALAVGDYYWGDHEYFQDYLNDSYGVFRVLWAGELLIERDNLGPFISVSLNTSGHAHRLIQRSSVDLNEPALFETILKQYRSHLLRDRSQHLAYSEEFPHLNPLYRMLFRRKQGSVGYTTVRHEFRQLLNQISILFDILSFSETMPWEKMAERLNGLSRQTMDDIGAFYQVATDFNRLTRPAFQPEDPLMVWNQFMSRGIANQNDFANVSALIQALARQFVVPRINPEVIVINVVNDPQ